MDIWVWIQHRDGEINPETYGLIGEALRLKKENNNNATIVGVAFGQGLDEALKTLGEQGIDYVLYGEGDQVSRYDGELYTRLLGELALKERPSYILMVQNAETADLGARVAAILEIAVITKVMDFKVTEDQKAVAIRPRSNGYLFEKLSIDCSSTVIVCFNPSVLTPEETAEAKPPSVIRVRPDIPTSTLRTRIAEVIEASAEDLDLEEADIIVAGGRGAGDKEQFESLHELAACLGGPVGGTRPVIDTDILPYERQIGQTGKIISPRLLVNCGISGANEYTAGTEQTKMSVAINTDEKARIFKFADLGLVGDVNEILPIAIDKIRKMNQS